MSCWLALNCPSLGRSNGTCVFTLLPECDSDRKRSSNGPELVNRRLRFTVVDNGLQFKEAGRQLPWCLRSPFLSSNLQKSHSPVFFFYEDLHQAKLNVVPSFSPIVISFPARRKMHFKHEDTQIIYIISYIVIVERFSLLSLFFLLCSGSGVTLPSCFSTLLQESL